MPGPITASEAERIQRLRSMGHTLEAVADIIRRSTMSVWRCEKRGYTAGVLGCVKFPVPFDFAARIPGMTFDEAAAHWGTSRKTIRMWAKRIGYQRKRGVMLLGDRHFRKRTMPEGMIEYWRATSMRACCAKFKMTNRIVKALLIEAGEIAPPKAPTAAPAGYEDFKRKLPRVRDMFGMAA